MVAVFFIICVSNLFFTTCRQADFIPRKLALPM